MMKSYGVKLFENWIFKNYLKTRVWKSNVESKIWTIRITKACVLQGGTLEGSHVWPCGSKSRVERCWQEWGLFSWVQYFILSPLLMSHENPSLGNLRWINFLNSISSKVATYLVWVSRSVQNNDYPFDDETFSHRQKILLKPYWSHLDYM